VGGWSQHIGLAASGFGFFYISRSFLCRTLSTIHYQNF
jgi:hypothetical protein